LERNVVLPTIQPLYYYKRQQCRYRFIGATKNDAVAKKRAPKICPKVTARATPISIDRSKIFHLSSSLFSSLLANSLQRKEREKQRERERDREGGLWQLNWQKSPAAAVGFSLKMREREKVAEDKDVEKRSSQIIDRINNIR
jgi:hypothetical protein